MDTEDQIRLLVEEENETEDSAFQNNLNDIKTTNNGNVLLNLNDEALNNGCRIHEGQNGNCTTNGSANGYLPIDFYNELEEENNGLHQETEKSSVYYDKTEGGSFISVFSGEESTKEGAEIESSEIGSQNGIVNIDTTSVIGYQHELTNYDSFSASGTQPSGIVGNINTVSQEISTIEEIGSANTELVDESDLDVAEIDLEEVLRKQKTHDLYCPNCNSCITRRVILSKRKRSTRLPSEDVKRNKLEAEIKTEAGLGSSEPISNKGPVSSNAQNSSTLHPAETYDRDGEPEIFRCLACFSFFIPTGNGFKLFGKKSEKSTIQKDQTSKTNKNWFPSIFAPNKGRTPQEQGLLDNEIKERNNKGADTPLVIDNKNIKSSLVDQAISSARITDELQQSGTTKPEEFALLGNMTAIVGYKSRDNAVKDKLGIDNGKEAFLYQEYDESVTKDAGIVNLSYGEGAASSFLENRPDGLKLLISSDRGPELLGRSPADLIYDMESKRSQDDEAMSSNFVTNNKAFIAINIPREYEQPTEILHDADTMNVKDPNRGKETIGTVTEMSSQITEEALVSTQVGVVEQRASETGENYGIEIIKSIVYGGLVTSITSLSVITSAAGGGASTLNTLALGLANLMGGIFIICHNLYQLNNDQADDAINQVSEKNDNDKYHELLGKRKNFVLHAFVAILSYLIFGMLPPIIFGFSFCESNDRELKLALVAAASFLCILVLAIAKAYVQTPPKTYVRTVLRYLILGFMVSCVSYVAGELLERLLNELGLFENSGLVPPLFSPAKPSNNQAWASF